MSQAKKKPSNEHDTPSPEGPKKDTETELFDTLRSQRGQHDRFHPNRENTKAQKNLGNHLSVASRWYEHLNHPVVFIAGGLVLLFFGVSMMVPNTDNRGNVPDLQPNEGKALNESAQDQKPSSSGSPSDDSADVSQNGPSAVERAQERRNPDPDLKTNVVDQDKDSRPSNDSPPSADQPPPREEEDRLPPPEPPEEKRRQRAENQPPPPPQERNPRREEFQQPPPEKKRGMFNQSKRGNAPENTKNQEPQDARGEPPPAPKDQPRSGKRQRPAPERKEAPSGANRSSQPKEPSAPQEPPPPRPPPQE